MKNRLSDLNNHLFAQLERLCDDEITGDALKQELERSHGISALAKDIINNASLVLKAQKSVWERTIDRKTLPAMLQNPEDRDNE
jgi:hypothetical protein